MEGLVSTNAPRFRQICQVAQESEFSGNTYPRRLNHILGSRSIEGSRYLEIGVEKGETFEAILAHHRVGVDPYPQFDVSSLPPCTNIFSETSDFFFTRNFAKAWDLVLVDGSHEANQTYRDIMNSVSSIGLGGFILVDDIWPTDFPSALPLLKDAKEAKLKSGISHRRWYGDAWKALLFIANEHPEIQIQVIGGADEHSQALLWVQGSPPSMSSHKARKKIRGFPFPENFAAAFPWSSAVSETIFLQSDPHFFRS